MSRFHGIAILMFFDENIHPGRPHFHAEHAGVRVSYDIGTLERIVGRLPRATDRMVIKWARLHQEEMMVNWQLLRSGQTPSSIDPLR